MSSVPQVPDPNAASTLASAEPTVDLAKTQSIYVNFCRVTATPEEVIVDFALMSDLATVPEFPLVAPQRIMLGYYTAKRLLAALEHTLQRFEAAFGMVEVAVDKRLVVPIDQLGDAPGPAGRRDT